MYTVLVDQQHQARVGQFANVVVNEETHRSGISSSFSRNTSDYLEDPELEFNGNRLPSNSSNEDCEGLAIPLSCCKEPLVGST